MSITGPAPSRRLIRSVPAALAFAGVAVILAACSSGGGGLASGSPVANLPGHSAGASALAPLTVAQSDQDFIDFARCMRGHGVAMADPAHIPGHSGLSIEVPQRSAANSAAWSACGHLIQPVVAMKQAGQASWAAANLTALTHYAECMRNHDIAMLDPGPLGQLNLGTVPGITNDYGRYSPQFRTADTACRHLLPAGVHDDGTGP